MLENRPPIVVILGHVDHGKTSLLDYLRKSNIAAVEAGGITQHIRSFQLAAGDHKQMTFIDTPGHAAFTAMRERGSKLADIAILVVSSADGVMPQTIESIDFIKKSNIPFVVALTKSDLPDSNVDKTKLQLSEKQVFVEDMGGDIPVISVSVKTGQGIKDLLEILGLLSEMNPVKADPESVFKGVVLESKLDAKRGPLSTLVVTDGTLRVGQNLWQKEEVGKVRAITNSEGLSLKEASPSQPVEILGLNKVLEVGSEISGQKILELKQKSMGKEFNPSAYLKIILKTDVIGSEEAIAWSLPNETTILESGTGDVNENDILSASANKALVVAFNVRCPANVAKLAEVEKVTVRSFKIIYELLDFLKETVEKRDVETVTGKAEIKAEFQYNADHVAGAKVIFGQINKTDGLKLIRNEKEVGKMKLKSLKNGKTDLSVAKMGSEFGAVFSPALDFRVGDIIIAFTLGHG